MENLTGTITFTFERTEDEGGSTRMKVEAENVTGLDMIHATADIIEKLAVNSELHIDEILKMVEAHMMMKTKAEVTENAG